MITLEQVKLLESKAVRAIEYVERVSRENAQLQGKLDSYQRRIDELEVVIRQFKEDQGRIEEGVLAALDRLNQFEDAIERSISPDNKKPKKPVRPPVPEAPSHDAVSDSKLPGNAVSDSAAPDSVAPGNPVSDSAASGNAAPDGGPTLEIEMEQETESEDLELLNEAAFSLAADDEEEEKEGPENGELDIF